MKLIERLKEEYEQLVKEKMEHDEATRKDVLEDLFEDIYFNGCDTKEDQIFKEFIEEELGLNII